MEEFFEKNGINAWIDVQDMGESTNLFGEITEGMNKASVIVSCLSDEYDKSKNCALEFRFAHVSLKIPIIKAIVGTGNDWRKNEISFLSGTYPEVNFQYENQGRDFQIKSAYIHAQKTRWVFTELTGFFTKIQPQLF